jgi:hypothetical protein
LNIMRFHSFSKQGRQLAMLCTAVAFSLHGEAKELNFDQVFDGKGETASLHFQASYYTGGAEHRMEVWRDHDRRVKRRTDDSVEIYAFHDADDAEFHMSILDMKKRVNTKISRTNLYRIGNFTDWFDFAHGLHHPKGLYQLIETSAPVDAPKPLHSCAWYELTQEGHASRICWSVQYRVPMLIATANGRFVWRVTELDRNAIYSKTFDIRDDGFVRNDANQDIEPD